MSPTFWRLRKIRVLPGYRETSILAATANAFAEDRDRCLVAGMNDFIAQPIFPDLIFSTLPEWLERGAASAPAFCGCRAS